MRRPLHALFLILVISLSLLGCTRNSKPLSVITGDSHTVPKGAAFLELESQLDSYDVEWSVSHGRFDREHGSSVVYIAPMNPGTYLVEARITGDLSMDDASFTVRVVDEPSLVIKYYQLDTEENIATISFKNEDGKERAIEDFTFSMFLWDEEGHQGERLLYQGQKTYRGRPKKEDLPLPYGDSFDQSEWDLGTVKEARSILPWVISIEFDDGEVWDLYERK